MNYKEQSREAIMAYVKTANQPVAVDDIIANAGVDKVRIYPILFELEQEGKIEVTERVELGSPSVVKLV